MMKFAIVVSKKDPAGLNIKDMLIKDYGFFKTDEVYDKENIYHINDDIKLYTIEKDTIFSEELDRDIDADIFIFATKHKSESKIKSLSVHAPGNWGNAHYGGRDDKVGVSPAAYLKRGVQLLEETNLKGFEVILECTHHGPYMEKPCMFIEIGSTQKEWVDNEPAKIVAKVIVELIKEKPEVKRAAVGIGGLHHSPNFKKIMLNSDIAVAHVCPKYSVVSFEKNDLENALKKSIPKADLVILDIKSLGGDKKRIKDLLDELDIEWCKTKDF